MDQQRYYARERDSGLRYEFRREIEEMTTMTRKLLESALEDTQHRTVSMLEARFAQLTTVLPGRIQGKRESAGSSEDMAQLIREMSHSLNTPLSQIEAALLTLEAELGGSGPQNVLPRLQPVRASVDACKSIIASFRELILMTQSATTWSPQSLQDALASASKLYMDQHKKTFSLVSDLPEKLPPLSNNYVISLLLPLLENAVEAGVTGSTISVRTYLREDARLFEVTGTSETIPKSSEIYRDGFTTKPGHSGTGLTIVGHLLSRYSGAKLTHHVNGKDVTFKISIPEQRAGS